MTEEQKLDMLLEKKRIVNQKLLQYRQSLLS